MPRERTYLRYQLYRSEARKRTALTFAKLQNELEGRAIAGFDQSGVRFEAINASALKAYEEWPDPHFCWEEVGRWKAKEPMSFDLAIWFDHELCGLCFANPNQSRLRVKIVRLEGKPVNDHPLKSRIATFALTAVTHFARIIGSQQIEIQEPVSGAIPLYRQLGFEFDPEGRLVKRID
ncbi:hypothetical protein HU727_000665 [Pseudomonas sp. SWRI153]|uniref:N-acetyltransferase domain-containing protein n=1 Tax=Pseudomonas khorasanensis TaxID=2745508 RepID=A0A923JF95_9PSED|nr:hypothetical protein [Pseudomonas khorasanensis]MBV4484095.1 hypothetical protein [Pseudomonas khorasanensis]